MMARRAGKELSYKKLQEVDKNMEGFRFECVYAALLYYYLEC